MRAKFTHDSNLFVCARAWPRYCRSVAKGSKDYGILENRADDRRGVVAVRNLIE